MVFEYYNISEYKDAIYDYAGFVCSESFLNSVTTLFEQEQIEEIHVLKF